MKSFYVMILMIALTFEINGQFFSSNDGIYLPRNGKRSFNVLKSLEKSNDIQKLKELLIKNKLDSKYYDFNSKENQSNDIQSSSKLDSILYRYLLKEWINTHLD